MAWKGFWIANMIANLIAIVLEKQRFSCFDPKDQIVQSEQSAIG